MGQPVQSDRSTVSDIVQTLRAIAIHSLGRMYYPDQRLFAFRLRKSGDAEVLEGISRRYTAIALLGLAGEDRQIAAEVLGLLPSSRHVRVGDAQLPPSGFTAVSNGCPFGSASIGCESRSRSKGDKRHIWLPDGADLRRWPS